MKHRSDINEFSMGRLWQHLSQGQYAIMSAERYELPSSENKKRTKALANDLRRLGLGFVKGIGSYKYDDGTESEEKIFLIPNISKKQARKLGLKYDQETIIFKDEDEDRPTAYYPKQWKKAPWAKWKKIKVMTPDKAKQAKAKSKFPKSRAFAFEGASVDLNEFLDDLKKQMVILVGSPASGKGWFVKNTFGRAVDKSKSGLIWQIPRLTHPSSFSDIESDRYLRRAQYEAAKEDWQALKKAKSEEEFYRILDSPRFSYILDGKRRSLKDILTWEDWVNKRSKSVGAYFGKKGDPVNKYYASLRGRESDSGEALKDKARKAFADKAKTTLYKSGDSVIVDTAGEDIKKTPFAKLFKTAKDNGYMVTLVHLNLPLELSIRRNEFRGKKGRAVPVSQIKAAFKALKSVVDRLRKDPRVDRYIRYDWVQEDPNNIFGGYYKVAVDDRTHLKRKLQALKAKKAQQPVAVPEALVFGAEGLFALHERREEHALESIERMTKALVR